MVVFLVAIVEILQQTKYNIYTAHMVWMRVRREEIVRTDIVACIHHISCLTSLVEILFDHNLDKY